MVVGAGEAVFRDHRMEAIMKAKDMMVRVVITIGPPAFVGESTSCRSMGIGGPPHYRSISGPVSFGPEIDSPRNPASI
jgi:phage terminase large subunit-like protein